MPRFALSEPSIGSITTTVSPRAEPPDLFRDDRHVELAEPRDDRILRGLVDRGRLVAAETLADDGLALVARRQLDEHALHVLDGRAADSSQSRHSGKSSKPLVSFG